MVEAGVHGAVVVGVSTGEEDEVVEVLTEVEAEVSTEAEVEEEVSTEGEVVVVGVSMEVEVEAEDVEDLRGAAVDLREEDTIRVPAALVPFPTWQHQNTRFIHCNKKYFVSLICVFIKCFVIVLLMFRRVTMNGTRTARSLWAGWGRRAPG